MSHTRLSFLGLLILTACTASPAPAPVSHPLSERLQNPLFAEQYWSDQAEHMADFVRNKDPLLKDGVKKAAVDAARTKALQKLDEVRASMKTGRRGSFLIATESIQGSALLLNNTLYFSALFACFPNPETHVYLSSVIDPRDAAFPDPTAFDAGALQSPYGDQTYVLPESQKNKRFNTVVIYDKSLNRIMGFAQL